MSNSRLVYSDEMDRNCSKCNKQLNKCTCDSKKSPPAKDGIVRVSRSTAGRKGKGVTIITGVPLQGKALKDLAKKMKQKCGSGGTVKNGIIEIQGEHRDTLIEALQKQGWMVKKAGG